ncbi:MAG: DUF4136 domain-containing protein [Bacteroidia bacterium]|nr:DUF4136 domain-containing protein [Bacteroidia bacterium]
MKKVLFTLTFVALCFALQAQNVYTLKQPGLIEGDYKTFSFLDQNKKSTMDKQEILVFDDPFMTSIWVFNDPKYPDAKSNADIQKAITQELIRKGFKKVAKGADMLVSYSVFSNDGNVKGIFTDDDGDTFSDIDETIAIKKGTLMISFIDRKTGKPLWHGFDKNALGQSTSIADTQVMKAVTSTLNSFSLD